MDESSINPHSLQVISNSLALCGGILVIASARFLIRRFAPSGFLGIPAQTWQAAVTLRILLLLALFASDVLIQNPNPPPWMARSSPSDISSFLAHLSNWDGGWYLGLATDGYSLLSQEGFENNRGQWAAVDVAESWRWAGSAPPQWKFYGPYHFFPLYPLLLRACLAFPGQPELIAFALSNLLFIVFLSALYRLSIKFGRPVAHDSVCLACVYPGTIFTYGAFSEPLFIALAAWCLVYVERQQLTRAGIAAALTSMARIPGVLVAVPMLVSRWLDGTERPYRLGPALASILPALSGLGLVVLYFYLSTGDPIPFVRAQRLGGYHLSAPWNVLRLDVHKDFGGLVLVPLWGALVVGGLLAYRWLSYPLSTYTLSIVALHSFHNHSALARFSLECFPLIIVLSILANRSEHAREIVYPASAMLACLLGTMFVNGYWAG